MLNAINGTKLGSLCFPGFQRFLLNKERKLVESLYFAKIRIFKIEHTSRLQQKIKKL